MTFGPQYPQVPNLRRGGEKFVNSSNGYHSSCQALGQEYPTESSRPISAVGIWNPTLQMKKLGVIKARPHR